MVESWTKCVYSTSPTGWKQLNKKVRNPQDGACYRVWASGWGLRILYLIRVYKSANSTINWNFSINLVCFEEQKLFNILDQNKQAYFIKLSNENFILFLIFYKIGSSSWRSGAIENSTTMFQSQPSFWQTRILQIFAIPAWQLSAIDELGYHKYYSCQ